MEKFSLQTGYHKRRAVSKARRKRRQRRRAAAVAASIAGFALLVTAAIPSFRHRPEPFSDKAQAKSLDDGAWDGSSAHLPFIRYGRKGWVLSDPTPYETLSVCSIEQRHFRCLLKEKEAHGAELQDIAKELTFVPR